MTKSVTAPIPARISFKALPDREWIVAWSSHDQSVAGSRTLSDPLDALIFVEARRRDLKAAGYAVSIRKGD